MTWRRIVRALWPFGHSTGIGEANAAVEAARRSHQRAVEDHRRAAATRAEADAWARQVRDHNVANAYDDWLARVIREGRR